MEGSKDVSRSQTYGKIPVEPSAKEISNHRRDSLFETVAIFLIKFGLKNLDHQQNPKTKAYRKQFLEKSRKICDDISHVFR